MDGQPGPAGQPGRDGVAGPAGPTATVSTADLEAIAAIIYDRMASEPERWRGPQGEQGAAPSIEDIVDQLPPRVVTLVGKNGIRQTKAYQVGEEITIRLVEFE